MPTYERCLRARTHCGRDEFRKVLARMDDAGMLDFVIDSTEAREYAAGIFPVRKSAERDRLVTNRRPRNFLERNIGAARELYPHATQACDIVLPPGHVLRGSGDDLPDFFHTIRCSDRRTATNVFGPAVPLADVLHLAAAKRLLSECEAAVPSSRTVSRARWFAPRSALSRWVM